MKSASKKLEFEGLSLDLPPKMPFAALRFLAKGDDTGPAEVVGLLTVLLGSRARNERTCHPAESCSDLEPPPETFSTRTVTKASFLVVDTNRRAAIPRFCHEES